VTLICVSVQKERIVNFPYLSIVVPVFGCRSCLEELCRRLARVIDALGIQYEVLLVDDRSKDGAWESIAALETQYPAIRGIRLSRNFGQHIAISAGLAESRGNYVIVMDCDLQDPPELIPTLIAKAEDGFDMVLCRRAQRNHSLLRVGAAKAYFWLLSSLTGHHIDGTLSTFSLLTRKVVTAYLRYSEASRHYIMILQNIGFNVGTVDFAHAPRACGKSSYSLLKLLNHAIDGVLLQSTRFLLWIVLFGISFGFAGFALAAGFSLQYFAFGSIPGWTSLAVLILITGGAVISSVGVIGIYVGKTFEQTRNRPLYIIDTELTGRPMPELGGR
jgi:glycosyltransferase involved in cell wall biosynthesis